MISDKKMEAFYSAENILVEVEQTTISDAASLEQFRIRFLGSKNILKDVMT